MNFHTAEKEVRNSTKKYVLYFAFTIVKRIDLYKEELKYSLFTNYDVFSSDSIQEIREYRDTLLSLVSEVNSYVLVIADKTNNTFTQKTRKFSKIKDICNYYKVDSKRERNLMKCNCRADNKENLHPVLHFTWGNKLAELDFFFRGPLEIPEDYKWDVGEYEGWLQFRWGDGKNAVKKENLIINENL